MKTYLLILHIIHIGSAVFWGGTTIMIHFFLMPAIGKLGPDGPKMMQTFMGTRKFPMVMTIFGTLTILSGVALMDYYSMHFKADWFTTNAGIALGFGAACGLGALLTGLILNKPAADRTAKIGAEIAKSGGAPTEAQIAEIQRNRAIIMKGIRWIAWLVIIAVVCMSGAKYF